MARQIDGYFINLDRSPARRRRMEEQLGALGLALRYQRFAGIEGASLPSREGPLSSGERGCYASHVAVLRKAAGRGRHAHILEDDVLLAPELPAVLERFAAGTLFDQLDLLYLDVYVPLDSGAAAEYQRIWPTAVERNPESGANVLRDAKLLELGGRLYASLSSYVVSERAIPRVATLLEESQRAGPPLPVDLAMRSLVHQGRLRAACCVPFLTSLDLTLDLESTIRTVPAAEARSRLAAGIVRHLFYLHPDWAALGRLVAAHFPDEPGDPRRALIGRMLDYRVFGDFRNH